MIKQLNLIFILFLLVCHSKIFGYEEYSDLTKKIIYECSKEVEKKYKLKLLSTGGSTAYDIRQINRGYIYLSEATIPEARRLYVETAEVFIKKFNENKELRPYLRDYPFNFDHLALGIHFRNNKGHQPKKGMVVLMCGGSKDICYFGQVTDDPDDLQEIFTEPYTEALKIVRDEKKQLLIKGKTP